MAGRVVRDGEDLCFVPRFAFLAGTTYAVARRGVALRVLRDPDPTGPPPPRCSTSTRPPPRCRATCCGCYVWFSAPMSEGWPRDHVRLVDDAGVEMAGALLPTEHELWDPPTAGSRCC